MRLHFHPVVKLSALLSLFALTTLGQIQPAEPVHARLVFVNEGDMIHMNCPELNDCAVQAPKGENFTGASLGFPDLFRGTSLDPPSPFFSIKAVTAGNKTSFHLTTDHKNQYGFILEQHPKERIDYSIILKSTDPEITANIAALPSVVPRAEKEALERQLAEADKRNAVLLTEIQKRVDNAEAQAVKTLQTAVRTYSFDHAEAAKQPWFVQDIFFDGERTCFRRPTGAPDLPSITSIAANGKPEIVIPKYDPDRGVYVVPEQIVSGYFSFGTKKKLPFCQPEACAKKS
jgi:hypothetical protein